MFVCPECGQSWAEAGRCATDGATLAEGDDALLGQMVGSYRVARLIGAGAMGLVYKGVQPTIGSRVAIKVLVGDAARTPGLVERFFAEARAVNLIRHENIVNVLDLAALPDGRPYIVMEYLDGEPLSALLGRLGPLPLGSLARLVSEVLGALGAAHQSGIVHRDLKPDNIFVTVGGHAKVLDFGIAKLKPEVLAMSDGTRTGSLLGTPYYMSPEQALGRAVDPRSDLYAAGVVLFECVTGHKPFSGTTLYDVLRQQVEQPPPPPRQFRGDLPLGYEQVVLRALQKDPAARYQSAFDFSAALGDAARALPEVAWTPLAVGRAQHSTAPMRAVSSAPAYFGSAPSGPPPPASSQSHAVAPPGYAVASSGYAVAPSAPPGYAVAPSAPPYATLPGYANTLSQGMPPAAPPPTKSSHGAVLVVILGGFGLLALVGMLAFFVGAGAGMQAQQHAASSSAQSAAADDQGGQLAPPESQTNVAGSSFDPWAFFPKARQLARQRIPDAELSMISILGFRGTDRIDLAHGGTVTYVFASLSRMRGRRTAGDCAVWVSVASYAKSVYTVPQCPSTLVGPPRCTGAELRSALPKTLPSNTTLTLTNASAPVGRTWTVAGTGLVMTLRDDCRR
jgi:serine/threonine protein kinase